MLNHLRTEDKCALISFSSTTQAHQSLDCTGTIVKLTLQKHGGLAAGLRQAPCIVESSDLPPSQQVELSRLVELLNTAPTNNTAGPGRMRDAMSYHISIDDEGQVTDHRAMDLNMSEAFANLKTWLERHSASS